jgi:tetratricopeptide (TPR) repeat protein
MSKHDPQADQLDMAKAMVYHRACLECDPANYRSANELGTLLARNGQMQEAKSMLKRSLLIRKTPEAWKNLAIVHERIGEKELAELANQEYLINSQADISNDAPSLIQWIDASNFNATAPLQFHESTANQANAQGNTANTPAEPKPEKLIDKVKKWF